MGSLAFLRDLDPEPIRDLLEWDKKTVSALPGAYILLADKGTMFSYPAGRSPVFYIGQAKGLCGRLGRHRQEIRQAKLARRRCVYPPVLEYGAAFGARFSYITAKRGQHPKALEDRVMALFAKRYLSLPVANGAGGWSRIRAIIEKLR